MAMLLDSDGLSWDMRLDRKRLKSSKRNGATAVVSSELDDDQYTGLHDVPSDHA